MYILLNRDNVLIDVLPEVRYVRRQTGANYTIACPEKEGVAVIGSDCDTHYPLISADTTNSPCAVRVMELDELPEGIEPGHWAFNPETGELEPYTPTDRLAEIEDAICEQDATVEERLAAIEDALCELDKN